jgi:hypothetical protein
MTRAFLAGILLLAAPLVHAHVGSPDVIVEGAAGPHPIRVVVRMPGVIPGQAEVTVRTRRAREARRHPTARSACAARTASGARRSG